MIMQFVLCSISLSREVLERSGVLGFVWLFCNLFFCKGWAAPRVMPPSSKERPWVFLLRESRPKLKTMTLSTRVAFMAVACLVAKLLPTKFCPERGCLVAKCCTSCGGIVGERSANSQEEGDAGDVRDAEAISTKLTVQRKMSALFNFSGLKSIIKYNDEVFLENS